MARRLAMQALYQWQLSGTDLVEIETQFLMSEYSKQADLDFFHELIHRIPAELDAVDQQFKPYLDRPIAELNPVELAIIRIGTYELMQRQDIPYRVIINEALELAKVFGAEEGYKYVNGILDRVANYTRAQEMQVKAKPTKPKIKTKKS